MIVFGIEALAFSPVQKQSAKNKHQRAINLPGLKQENNIFTNIDVILGNQATAQRGKRQSYIK